MKFLSGTKAHHPEPRSVPERQDTFPFRASTLALAAVCLTTATLHAQQHTALTGEVRDPLGAPVAGATVELLQNHLLTASAISDAAGQYQLPVVASGRYTLRTSAPTFATSETSLRYLNADRLTHLDLTVATPTLTQQITVTATGTPTPEAQIGASDTVLAADNYKLMTEVQEPLRLIPGLQVTQAGQRGGTTGLRIRGGDTDSTKVLIDGVPANQVGGNVEFANIATVGFSQIEVLREPASVLYGSDALSGVVALTTERGNSRLPLFTYAGDAGNFGQYRNEVTAGSTYKKFDQHNAFVREDTRGSEPNSQFHNATYSGNFGYALNAANEFRFTTRRTAVSSGQPNSLAFYGIADSGQQKEQDQYYSASWNNQATPAWHNQIRYGGSRQHSAFNTFGATGIYDPVNGIYDGRNVTITGANGYSVTGVAAFQFSGDPSSFLSKNTRDFVYAQTDYRLNPHLNALGGFKFESETGQSGASPSLERGNYSYTAQLAGDVKNRLFVNAGAGLENNGQFGFAATPRVSAAYYLVRPGATGAFTGTKLHGTFAKGIKESSVFQAQNSLLQLLTPQQAATLHVGPLGAENSRTYDVGVDQELFNGRARLGVTYFHNQYTNRVEFVPPPGVSQLLGIAANPVVDDPNFFGAYLNSSSFRSLGLEVESELRLSNHLFARAGYTYTDAVVENSFSSDVLTPSFNPAGNFSSVLIGAYSPLRGARPFRVAPHTGYFAVNYTRQKFYTSLSGTLVGRRDDSTFLSDANFGTTLLLPNRNLDGAYQRLALGGGYSLTPRVSVYTEIQNLLSEHYFEAFGYPSLPLTFRSGLKLNFGGENFKLR